ARGECDEHPSPDEYRSRFPNYLQAIDEEFANLPTVGTSPNGSGGPVAPSSQHVLSPPGYQILGEFGRGSMGVVYHARQVHLNRVVALKMILAGSHANPAALTRFRTEAKAIACLQHPNIVQIYEVGEHAGLPFFSMEFCPGQSLVAKMSSTPLPPREAALL